MNETKSNLPGAELIAQGLCDLDAGTATIASLLVSIGAPRPELYRFPAIDPASFRAAVDEAFPQ